ncbi:FtsB family cell division protein [Stenotrophomonas acidaminiphila]|uniref:FtsB family cell division protein n=1 Tax=Stenotrophomonas acidaminiphila TaxID=128780 RepID=UPI0028B134AE|nr:hypothetical protein [Stenotrophomonas acidaminiphila]
MSGDEKIIQAFPARDLPECPVDVERRVGFCQHRKITLVEHDREVVCTECGAKLDPFNYLLAGALAMRHGWSDHRYVVEELKRKRQQLEDLEKARKRLQAQVRRLKQGHDALDLRKPL